MLAARADALARIRAEPSCLTALRAYYRAHPEDFIQDWGMTFDPRALERGLPALFPFVPWAKQREWLLWVLAHWRASRPGLTEKSRDCGISWLAVGLSCSLSLFHDDMAIGFGSRKEEYVDKGGDPKSLFEKARIFMRWVPPEFGGGWDERRDAPHMRLLFRGTGAIISGEAGDNIGRGDRKALYFVDEAAHLENPESVEMSLSMTTNCRMDVSSVNGMLNPFAKKRHAGKVDVFTFHWRDDPRKDDAWRARLEEDGWDAITIAQEIEIDYSASVEGVLIPMAWLRSAVGAAERLGVRPTGEARAALDVADEGPDLNAFAELRGIEVRRVEEWSGKAGDIYGSTQRAFGLCDEGGLAGFTYDADGLGAGVRGDARVINEARVKEGRKALRVEPYRGSGAVKDPDRQDVEGRKNEDFFLNRKAQAAWGVRRRFELTHRWVTAGKACAPDDIVSIPSTLPLREKLVAELGQILYTKNGVGKVLVIKTPPGMKSPNLADAVIMASAGPASLPVVVPREAMKRLRQMAQSGAVRRFRPRLG